MQPVDKFMLLVAVFWALLTVHAVLLLLPFMERRAWEWEIKLKCAKISPTKPNRPQRVIFLLLTCLMTAVALTSAFHRDLRETIGISSGTACLLMMILPALYFTLGRFKTRLKSSEQPKL